MFENKIKLFSFIICCALSAEVHSAVTTISAVSPNTGNVDVRFNESPQIPRSHVTSLTCESNGDPAKLAYFWGVDSVSRLCDGQHHIDYVYNGSQGDVVNAFFKFTNNDSVSRLAKITIIINDNTFSASNTITANATCSVDIETNPRLPDLYPNSEISEVTITSNASGGGSITFTPDQSTQMGGAYISNGSSTLKYSVTASKWDGSKFMAGSIGQHAIKLQPIPSDIEPGYYKGTLTAIISCG